MSQKHTVLLLEYWSVGVLECWGSNSATIVSASKAELELTGIGVLQNDINVLTITTLLQYSITPILHHSNNYYQMN
jgi:hypothetical protein